MLLFSRSASGKRLCYRTFSGKDNGSSIAMGATDAYVRIFHALVTLPRPPEKNEFSAHPPPLFTSYFAVVAYVCNTAYT